MKKLFLGLTAIVLFSLVGFSRYTDSMKLNDTQNKAVGKIHIHFHGGNLCWLSGAACEGEIIIEWKPAPPSDVDIAVPAGYQVISMETSLYGKSSQTFTERTFNSSETSDSSTIYIPLQEGKYSNKINAFVLYAKRIK